MDKLLALTIGGKEIKPPTGIKSGGLGEGEAGQQILQFGVDALFFTAAILAVIFVLIAGIKWITAGGDKTKVQSARGTMTYAIIGLVIVMAAFLIISLLGKILGFQLLPQATRTNSVSCATGKGGPGQDPCDSPYGPYCRDGQTKLTLGGKCPGNKG